MAITNTKNSPSKRFYQIDLFRFIAALGIVLVHYLFRGYRADNLSQLSFSELGDWMKYFFVFIDLFFIISGFVIALSIRGKTLKEYVKSRVLRVFSVYWVCVLITSIIILFFGAPRFSVTLSQFFANLTFMHELIGFESIDGVYWTMIVEVKFYLLSVLYLVVLKFKKVSTTTCAYLWLLLSILHFIFSDFILLKAANLLLIFDWAPAFIAGMLMADIYKKKNISLLNGFSLLVCVILSMTHRLQYMKTAMVHYNTDGSEPLVLILVFLMYLAVFAVVRGKLKFLNKPYFIYLGILTYPLYLLHQNIGYIIFNRLGDYINKYVLVIAVILLMMALSYAVNRWIEAPITRYLNKLFNSIGKKTYKLTTRIGIY